MWPACGGRSLTRCFCSGFFHFHRISPGLWLLSKRTARIAIIRWESGSARICPLPAALLCEAPASDNVGFGRKTFCHVVLVPRIVYCSLPPSDFTCVSFLLQWCILVSQSHPVFHASNRKASPHQLRLRRWGGSPPVRHHQCRCLPHRACVCCRHPPYHGLTGQLRFSDLSLVQYLWRCSISILSAWQCASHVFVSSLGTSWSIP